MLMRLMKTSSSSFLSRCTVESPTSSSTTGENGHKNYFSLFYDTFRTISSPNIQQDYAKTFDSNFKGVLFTYMADALLFNMQNVKNRSLKICSERFLLNQRVFYFPKDFYLVEEFNHQISVLSANGILTKILSEFVDQSFLSVKSENAGPSPISWNQISGIFFITSIGLLISFFVFVSEISSNLLKSMRNSYCNPTRPRNKSRPLPNNRKLSNLPQNNSVEQKYKFMF
jgi:hypothetical protein